MKTLAELEAKIAENFKQLEALPEIRPPTYGYKVRRGPDEEEQLVTKMWDEVFAPRVGKNVTIFWRRHLGFQLAIPDGKILSMRADFVQESV